jgi:hypothetical protein
MKRLTVNRLSFGMKETGGVIKVKYRRKARKFGKKNLCFLDTKRTILNPGEKAVILRDFFMILMICQNIIDPISNGVLAIFWQGIMVKLKKPYII